MKFSLTFASLLVAVTSIEKAHAWFRVPCNVPLVHDRVDPIISPQSNPSNHVHTVHGASNFARDSTFNSLRASRCTSCTVKDDLSNYWFPKLYFQDPRTKQFENVPNGGLLIYYQNRGEDAARNGGKGIRAFPAGFRMISGNPRSRSKKYPVGQGTQEELRERANHWECLRYTTNQPSYANTRGEGFPWTDCEAGFNARIHMPACWDGRNLDSPDHTTHVAYLSEIDNGKCPPSHPVTLLKILYEVTWDVTAFKTRWNPSVDKWPFVWATGDPTGYSWHGDFQNGWDVNVLQNAIDRCDNVNDQTGNGITEACPYFTLQSPAAAAQCKANPAVNEQVNGVLNRLPGCNPIQAGPGDSTLYNASNCPI